MKTRDYLIEVVWLMQEEKNTTTFGFFFFLNKHFILFQKVFFYK